MSDNGSSPHARETLRGAHQRGPRGRLIPACAGNTPPRLSPLSPSSAHPRMRGKHMRVTCPCCSTDGSSPHARETLVVPRHGSCDSRLIPACAGNTGNRCDECCRCAAHPRMRGKHPFVTEPKVRTSGSSPHARETHERNHCLDRPARLIPACAGNTPAARRTWRRLAAHPRMRGKHALLIEPTNHAYGSSPHARETLDQLVDLIIDRRLIPACAGNTGACAAP